MLYITIVFILLGFGVYLVKTDNKTLTLPAFYLSNNIPLPEKQVASPSAELAIVKRVIDGDTIVLSDDRRVRYIGINAPEMASSKAPIRCFAQEATNKNRELVEGKKISMQKDISEVDKYKRLLRYVWINGIFVNEYLVREGYAQQDTYPPDIKYVKLFKKAAEEARTSNKGLWNMCK